MNRKRIRTRKNLIGAGSARWCILAALIMGFLGVSYAAHTNALYGAFRVSTGSMDFIFDEGNSSDCTVMMQNGPNGAETKLDGHYEYDDKTLKITDIGPIEMEDLMGCDAVIKIPYTVKPSDEEIGIRRPAEVNEDAESGYDLGTVVFERRMDTPVWSLGNDTDSWGSKSDKIGGTPHVVYQYLPEDLGRFHVYNELRPALEDGVMEGTLTLKQESAPDMPETMEVGLASLDLPDDVISEIKDGSTELSIQVKGSYEFTIPLDLEQFNAESER